MQEKKVTFIVPVYNVEKYLERCINSILNQTYKNLELILVNDGSPDNSQDIIDKYSKIDNRIISIKKKNEGVSIARNVGLDKATGEYILFVDSDDYIDDNYAEYFISLIEKDGVDVAVSLNCHDDCNTNIFCDEKYELLSSNLATEKLYLNKIGVAVWNKIYRKKFLDENKIKFNSNFWFAEGMTFNIECFQNTNNIATGQMKVYHQIYNPESAVRKFNLKSWYCGMEAMRYQKKMLSNTDENVINAWNYHYKQYYFSILRGIYISELSKTYRDVIKECRQHLHKNISFSFKARLTHKEKLKGLLISLFPITMAKYITFKEKKLSTKNY